MSTLNRNQDLKIYYSLTPLRANMARRKQEGGSQGGVKRQFISHKFNQKGFLAKLEKIERVPKGLLAYFQERERGKVAKNITYMPVDLSDSTKISNIVNGFLNVTRDFMEVDLPDMTRLMHTLSKEFQNNVQRRINILKASLDEFRAFFKGIEDPNFDPLNTAVYHRFKFNKMNYKLRNLYSEGVRMTKMFDDLLKRQGGGSGDIFTGRPDSSEISWKFR